MDVGHEACGERLLQGGARDGPSRGRRFVTVRDGLIGDLTEVWADVGVTAPEGARPV